MRRTAIALFFVALALRPQIVVVGPLLPGIQADLAMSHSVAGLLATIPVLCMGFFALVAPVLGRLIGTERAIAAGVVAIVLFGALRALAPDALNVLLLTFGVGVGIAVIGPLLPMVVHQRVANRAAVVTGAYAGGIVLGATLAAGLAVPLAGPELDWRLPLAVFSLASLGPLFVWLLLERPSAAQPAGDRSPARPLPWRHRRAWALALMFGAQSILFYASVAWLPSIYIERGWSAADAGLLVAVVNGVGLITTFGAPALSERRGSRREQLGVSAVLSLVGVLGITLLPEWAPAWVIFLGIGLGAVFPLALTLPVDLSERPDEAGGTAAIMLFGGYALAAVGPFLLGVARDVSGSFDLSLWSMVGVALALLATIWLFVPAGLGRVTRIHAHG